MLVLGNLLFANTEYMTKYLINIGKETLTFIFDCANDIYLPTKKFALKAFVNMLLEDRIVIDGKIIFEILNSILKILSTTDHIIGHYNCVECILLIIHKSIMFHYQDDLRRFLIEKGVSDLLMKYETNILNENYFHGYEKDEDEKNALNFINEINHFINHEIKDN